MKTQCSVPFPPTLFPDYRGFKSCGKSKTSMQFAPNTKGSLRSSFPYCILNQVDSSTRKHEHSKPQFFACKIDYPESPSVHCISDNRSPFLPSIVSNAALRLMDTQFTVFLDYPQSKSDLAFHTAPSSCSLSDAKSQRNIITHSHSSSKVPQPHAGLLMLLNCAQPGVGGCPADPMRPTKRLNDYTGDFKKEFCALLCTNNEARAEWDHFWRKHGCTGKRPCIKAYLAFCELYKEFSDLRLNPRYRVLGTRTACKCTRTIHSFQPPRGIRYAPY